LETPDKQDRLIHASFRTFMRIPPPVQVSELKDTSAYGPRPQYKDYPQLWFCREGEYLHETEYGTYHCKSGSLLIVPPGVAHKPHIPQEVNTTALRVSLTYDYLLDAPFDAAPNTATLLFLPVFLRQAGCPVPEHYTLSETSCSAAEEAFAVLASENREEAAKRSALEHILSLPELCFPAALKELAAAQFKQRLIPVLRALSYLQVNFSQKITAEHLCQASSLCRTNLFRWVRQYLGISWASYLVMIRITRANHALVHTNYSIAYISDMCGFSHSSHMSSCYKRYKGILPKDDRQKQLIYQKRYGKLHITHEFFMDDFFE